MKQVSTTLQTIVAGTNIAFRANLYTISLAGPLAGTVLYLTDGDQDLVLDGITFLCGAGAPASVDDGTFAQAFETPFGGIASAAGEGAMGIARRSRSRVASDLSIDDTDLFLSLAALSNAISAPRNALLGSFDGCGVRVDAAFMSTYGDLSAGVVPDVSGVGYPADIGSTHLRLSIKGLGEELLTPLPRRLVQLNCPYDFCSARCSLPRTRYAANYTCAAGCTKTALTVDYGTPALQSPYASVWFTSGALAGQHRPLLSTAYPLQLQVGLPSAPAVGDKFTLRGGCDKSRTGRGSDTAHCCFAYGNLLNYGGFPDTPSAALQGGK